MVSTPGFTQFGKAYLWAVIAAGFAVIGASLYQLVAEPISYQWFILAALTLLSGSATVRLPSSSASISISETFVFTAVLLYGPAAGTVIVALDGLVISFWISKRYDEPHRALFNMSAPAVSAWLSAHLFFRVAHIAPLVQGPSSTYAILPALVLFALTYFALNSWLITLVIALERHLNPIKVWTNNFVWLSLNYFGGASVAFLFVGFNRSIDLGYVGVIVPLLLVLYFTFKTTMGRVEDADKHVEQIDRLYMSTIETLAMAIDAKDQVTHGHIRRVQAHATSLAREVGVRDETLLKAIEAAALLHDMGKLAVPEYILNKPGKLTETEFEKMKLHAGVGADILSAIDFPYPVVPIVRHHHENWDGTGYPSGLRGTDIPIGARVLSVVDCFDALTSDRPYRPKMSDEEALAILLQRRGSMYDPIVVDTFMKVHVRIPPELPRNGPPSEVLNTIAHSQRTPPAVPPPATLDEMTASADQMLTMYELARALAGHVKMTDAADVIAKHLRRLIPWSLFVFYVYEPASDEIVARHLVGEGTSIVRGLRIALGGRLSGWVAANRQTISNSDPSLDLGELASSHLQLKSCLSTALLSDDRLIGVLSLYSSELNGFNDDHRRIIEVVGTQIAHTFSRAIEFENSSRRDSVTGLPPLDQLATLIHSTYENGPHVTQRHALLFIDVLGLNKINMEYGRSFGDDVLRHVVRQTRAGLRVADILFRNTGDEFVAFLGVADADTTDVVARRIREAIIRHPVDIPGGAKLTVRTSVIAVSSPRDGASLQELLAVAKERSKLATATRGGPSIN
jgi:diguanylate cyclase (GGDEF)-like protein/putative nucleotidyltransferase with HDIG domain